MERRQKTQEQRWDEAVLRDEIAFENMEADWIMAGCDSPKEFEEALKCPIVQRPDQLWSPDVIAEDFGGVDMELYAALWVVAVAIEKGTVDPGNWFKELSDSDQKKTKIACIIDKNETDQLFAEIEASRGTDRSMNLFSSRCNAVARLENETISKER